ncbi:hypothetical protein AB0M29_25180 [Streptomyces sp. NPDC051976]
MKNKEYVMSSILGLQRLEITSPDESELAIHVSLTSCDARSCSD